MVYEQTDKETAVYYRPEDYVGFGRRLVIEAVDAIVAIVASGALSLIVFGVMFASKATEAQATVGAVVTWMVIWYVYFVPIKRYRRTLGYRVGHATIVNLQGEPAGLYSLTLRLLWAIFGPLNTLLDLVWITNDECHQALRDKLARTYVVSDNAVPAGRAPIRWNVYHMFGMTFTFGEVSPRSDTNVR